MDLIQIAKLCWQDQKRGANWLENCKFRLDKINYYADPLDMLRRGDWEYELRDEIFGSVWFINGPSSGLTIIPGCKAYRLSETNYSWTMYENELHRPVRFQSSKNFPGAIDFSDLSPIRPNQVPDEVYTLYMFYSLAKAINDSQS